MRTRLILSFLLGSIGLIPWLGSPTAAAAESAPATVPAIVHPPGQFIAVNGARLWYESEGSGQPVVLIAGGPGLPHDYFHPFFSALARTNRVIYFDALGRGKSDHATSPAEYTFDRDVRDVVRFCQTLNLGPVILAGHSYGGMVAQAVALRHPDLVRKLVLADTFHSADMCQAGNDRVNHDIQSQFPEIWEQLQRLRAQGVRSSAPAHQSLYFAVPMGLSFFCNASQAAKLPEAFSTDVYYAIAGADADFVVGGDMAALDFRPQLKNLKMPVLILSGRFDRMAAPRYALQFKAYAPQAEFVMFEHSGHFPFLEEPEKVLATLRAFLAR